MPDWLIPLIAAVSAFLSAVVVWGFVTGRWVQVREDDHGEIERLRKELATLEDTRRQWSERVNVDIGKLQGQWSGEEKIWLLKFQHVDEEVRTLKHDLQAIEARLADLQRQIDRRPV